MTVPITRQTEKSYHDAAGKSIAAASLEVVNFTTRGEYISRENASNHVSECAKDLNAHQHGTVSISGVASDDT